MPTTRRRHKGQLSPSQLLRGLPRARLRALTMCTARSSGRSWCHWSCVTGTERSSWVCSHPSPGSGPELDPSSVALPLLLLSSKPLVPSPTLPLPAPDPSSLLSPFSLTLPAPCHAPGQMWKALPEAEKAKYKVGLTPLPASGRGGMHAWVPTSSPCLPSTPITTAVPGRVHPPLPATPAPPPTLAAQSAAPAAPPVAPLPSSSEATTTTSDVAMTPMMEASLAMLGLGRERLDPQR